MDRLSHAAIAAHTGAEDAGARRSRFFHDDVGVPCESVEGGTHRETVPQHTAMAENQHFSSEVQDAAWHAPDRELVGTQIPEDRVPIAITSEDFGAGDELSLISRDVESLAQLFPLSPEISCAKITTLNLHYNAIQTIECMDALTSLTVLKLSSNEITKMEGLDHLLRLKVLDLSCNQLKVVEGLSKLTALEELVLAYNSIHSLHGMGDVSGPSYKLRSLDIADNEVSDLGELSYLRGCVLLQKLCFKQAHLSNPICALPSYPAAVAASVGSSLKTLDGDSLVTHLGRMAQFSAVNYDAAAHPSHDGSNYPRSQKDSAHQGGREGNRVPGPGGSSLDPRQGTTHKITVHPNQVKEITPQGRPARTQGGGAAGIAASRPEYGPHQPYMPHVRLVGELGEDVQQTAAEAERRRMGVGGGRATPYIDQVLNKHRRRTTASETDAGPRYQDSLHPWPEDHHHARRSGPGGYLEDRSPFDASGLEELEQELRLERLETQVAMLPYTHNDLMRDGKEREGKVAGGGKGRPVGLEGDRPRRRTWESSGPQRQQERKGQSVRGERTGQADRRHPAVEYDAHDAIDAENLEHDAALGWPDRKERGGAPDRKRAVSNKPIEQEAYGEDWELGKAWEGSESGSSVEVGWVSSSREAAAAEEVRARRAREQRERERRERAGEGNQHREQVGREGAAERRREGEEHRRDADNHSADRGSRLKQSEKADEAWDGDSGRGKSAPEVPARSKSCT